MGFCRTVDDWFSFEKNELSLVDDRSLVVIRLRDLDVGLNWCLSGLESRPLDRTVDLLFTEIFKAGRDGYELSFEPCLALTFGVRSGDEQGESDMFDIFLFKLLIELATGLSSSSAIFLALRVARYNLSTWTSTAKVVRYFLIIFALSSLLSWSLLLAARIW